MSSTPSARQGSIGRRLALDYIHSRNAAQRAGAERAASQGLPMSVAARVGSVSLNGTDLTLNTRELGPVALASVQQII